MHRILDMDYNNKDARQMLVQLNKIASSTNVVISRPKQFYSHKITMFIDGEKVGKFSPRDTENFYVVPGTHSFFGRVSLGGSIPEVPIAINKYEIAYITIKETSSGGELYYEVHRKTKSSV